MEHFAGEKITNENAFDVSLRGVGRALDLTRCIAIPFTGERIHSASEGFEYSFDWSTFTVTKRPYKDVQHLAQCVRREIDGIYDAMAHNRLTATRRWWPSSPRPTRKRPRKSTQPSPKSARPWAICAHPGREHRRPDHSLCAPGWELFIYLMGDEPELVDQWLEALCAYEVKPSMAWPIASSARSRWWPMTWPASRGSSSRPSGCASTGSFAPALRRRLAQPWHQGHLPLRWRQNGNPGQPGGSRDRRHQPD